MKKPIIGILARNTILDEKSQICISEDYRLAVVKAGGIPLLLMPNNEINYGYTRPRDAKRLTSEEKEDLLRLVKTCDGFLMPGGTRWYDYDEIVCQYALENDVPILGICLGMQMLGNIDNFFGSEKSIKTVQNETELHYQEQNIHAHQVKIVGEKLREILKRDSLLVNSRHNYHIIKKDFFEIEAIAENGIIEGIRIPGKRFALGVQWHPENMVEEDPIMLEIFKALIDASKKGQK